MMFDAEIVLRGHGTTAPVQLTKYPDGMPLLASPLPVKYPEAILVRPLDLGTLVTAMTVVDAYAWRGVRIPTLVLPFFPGARQDRLNDSGDYLFTAKTVANMVNARAFDRVVVADPHSDVVPALVDRCRVVKPHEILTIPAGKYAAVVAPDGGAEKRANGVAQLLGVPLVHAWKTRDVATGKISGFGVQPMTFADVPPGALVLVVDDICDGGGTFLGLAKELDQLGLRAHLYVTHGIFSQGTEKLLEAYQGHVYATDTVLAAAPGVIRVPICERLLQEWT